MYKNPHSHANSPLPNFHPTPPPPLPPPPPPPPRHEPHNNPSMFAFQRRIMLAAATWLHTRRSRCVFLLLCSPLLLPLLCATFPLLCFAELCIHLCRRSRRKKNGDDYDHGDERIRRCEEGFCGCGQEDKEVGLLQRYLEDQLRLVGSVYKCGDDFDHDDDDDDDDDDEDTHNLDYNINTPLLG